MLKKLLKDGKIKLSEYRIYTLYSLNDDGAIWLKEKKDELFKVSVRNDIGSLAFLEGNRNVIKEIEYVLEKIEQLIKEQQ
jgi:hypothetical protein